MAGAAGNLTRRRPHVAGLEIVRSGFFGQTFRRSGFSLTARWIPIASAQSELDGLELLYDYSAIDSIGAPPMKPSVVLEANRVLIRQVVLAHRSSNPRVFGSVLKRSDSENSDLDLLVEPSADASLLDIARIQVELEARLGVAVDVLTPASLPERFRSQVLREASPV